MNIAIRPGVVQVRRAHLLGLVVAALTLGATSTWALSVATETPSNRTHPTEAVARDVSSREAVLASLSPSARKHVEGLMEMTDAQLVAAFGTGPVDLPSPTSRDVSSREAVLASLSPSARKHVEGLMEMTDAELVAVFGTGPVDQPSHR